MFWIAPNAICAPMRSGFVSSSSGVGMLLTSPPRRRCKHELALGRLGAAEPGLGEARLLLQLADLDVHSDLGADPFEGQLPVLGQRREAGLELIDRRIRARPGPAQALGVVGPQ